MRYLEIMIQLSTGAYYRVVEGGVLSSMCGCRMLVCSKWQLYEWICDSKESPDGSEMSIRGFVLTQ